MSTINKQFTFSSGATIIASEHNTNFDTIYTDYNGNITNANIASGAAIANSKLNLASISQNISLSGNLTLTGSANDFSGATISDLGTVTTADINGGTIDAVTLNASTISGTTGIDLGSDATGDIYYRNSSGDLTRLAKGTSGQFLQIGASIPAWANLTVLSNVIFAWSGLDGSATDTHGMFMIGGGTEAGHTQTPDLSGATYDGHNMFLAVYGSTYRNMLRFQYVHLSSISTITVKARLWSNSVSGVEEAVLNVDIGGGTVSGTVQSTTSITPTWYTGGTPLDVSGLTPGTAYEGIIQLKNEAAAQNAYCSAVTLIAS